MAFSVLLTESAARDLEEIHDYVAQADSPRKADAVLSRIERGFQTLESSPLRGVWPRELASLGIREHRQVFFKPYRIVYQVSGNHAFVLLIADGRRDMRSLLPTSTVPQSEGARSS